MDWRSALLRQARSDYELLNFLRLGDAPLCHQLHYLQMATEKLAKGFTTPRGGPPPPRVHRAFVRFVQSARGDPHLQRACNCGPGQVDAYVASLLPLARLIEDLAPAVANNGPNPEYPWPTPDGITAPVDHVFPALQFNSRSLINMLTFLDRCFQII